MSNNLLPSQPICYSGLERVSLSVSQLLRRFSDDRQKGSVTAEAAVAVPVFFLAVVTMLYLLEMMAVHTAVRSGLQYAGKKVAKESCVTQMLMPSRIENDLVYAVGEERLGRSIVRGGSSGIDCSRSKMSARTGIGKLTAEYQVVIPVPLFGIAPVKCSEKMKIKAWSGYEREGWMDTGNDTVYVTETGLVYHKDYHCSHLDLSIRMTHLELVHDRRYNDTSDMESQMYPSVDDIKAFLEKDRSKPFICCEYTHAMGNSCGGMHKYTDLTDTEPSYQGGFIWDYIDQSIYKKDRYGKEFQAYGGDFNDRPCDYNFSGNGIAYGGERDASPKMQDVKFNYQNISAKVEKDQVTIVNKNLFINTDTFDCFVALAKDGKEVKEVPMETHVAPLSEETVSLPIPVQTLPGEYAVTVSFRLKEDTVWAKRGHEVAFGQGVYKVEAPAKAVKPARFEVIRFGHDFGVRGENFDVLFSYLNGGLASYRYGGVEMIQMIPRPNFWRAPVDNDNGSLMQMRCGQWKLASMYLSHKYPTGGHYPGMHIPEIEVLDDSAKITFTYAMPTTPATECKLSYQVYGDGSIRTTLTYDPVEGLGDMPEFGVMFKFDADYDNVTWYGMGPEETYVDRCEGAKLGIYRNKVEDNMAKYMVPQECGNKVGVRWASVTDRKGRGMLFTGDAMEFSALPYTPHEMENAMHPFELPQVHYTVVRVSKQQMGIAGDDSWGAKPLPEYLIKTDEKMEFTFTFKGI